MKAISMHALNTGSNRNLEAIRKPIRDKAHPQVVSSKPQILEVETTNICARSLLQDPPFSPVSVDFKQSGPRIILSQVQ